jgi:multidrug efflux system outer membrane protein
VHFLLALGLLLPPQAGAAVPELSWDECLREVRAENPRLASAEEGIRSARATWRTTWSNWLPSVNGVAEEEKTAVIFTDAALNTGTSTIYRIGPKAAWNLFNGFGSTGASLSAWHTFKQAHAAKDQTAYQLRFQLRDAFGQLLFLEKQAELLRGIAAKLHGDADFVKVRYEGGVAARWSWLEAEAAAEEADWEALQADLRFRSEKKRLLSVLGRPATDNVRVKGELATPPPPEAVDSFVESARNEHPDVKFQFENVEIARGLELKAQSAVWPSATLTYSYLWQEDVWPPTIRSWDLLGNITLPLFNGGANVNGILAARDTVRQQEGALEDVKNAAGSAVEDAFAQYRASFARLKAVRTQLAASAEREETMRAQYKAGNATFFEWNFAVTEYVDVQKAELNARLDAYSAQSAWERSLGVGLEETR